MHKLLCVAAAHSQRSGAAAGGGERELQKQLGKLKREAAGLLAESHSQRPALQTL